MLQIIGWLGCAYMLLKVFEIIGSSAHRKEDGRLNDASCWACVFAIFSAGAFAVWLLAQGNQFEQTTALSGSNSSMALYSDCMAKADGLDAMTECLRLLD